MTLLYVHSPLPPAQTGIADYAFETLAGLKDHFDIAVVDDGTCRDAADRLLLPTIPVEIWRDLRSRSSRGLDLYHLGNNRFHTGILQRALGNPGLCVVHDASLTGLLLSSPSLSPAFRRFTEYELGIHADRLIAARENFEIFDWQDFVLRNLGLVADSSLGVVVHSAYVASMIKRRHRPPHLFHLHHHLADRFRTREGAGIGDPMIVDFLRANENRVKVATFGFLTPPKRIDWLVEATKYALDAGADIALILGGREHSDTKIPELFGELPPDRALVTGYLSEPDMRGLMCAVDLNVALRFPSVGETSGTLTRALGLGVPSVVLDHEAFSELADEHVTKIPLTSDAPRKLGEILIDFCADRQKYVERASIAREWVIRNASLEQSIAGFVDAIRTIERQKPVSSNLYRDLASDLLTCICSRAQYIRLEEPVVTSEDLAERIGDALLTDPVAVAVVKACRAEYVPFVVDPHRDKSPAVRVTGRHEELDGTRLRKAVLVVSSVDVQICNIDYVVEEVAVERFDALVFVLLPASLMGPPVVSGNRPFDEGSRLPAYLRERGRGSASLRVSAGSLNYIKTQASNLPSEEIEVPIRIIACEALI